MVINSEESSMEENKGKNQTGPGIQHLFSSKQQFFLNQSIESSTEEEKKIEWIKTCLPDA